MKVNIGAYPDEGEQVVEVEIHDYDTWSMDYTLAPIILPMLVQLRDTKQGVPLVDSADVPWGEGAEPLNQSAEDIAEMVKRWDYVLSAMIFSFDKLVNNPDWPLCLDGKFVTKTFHTRGEQMQLGFTLFGKYYQSLWD